MNGKRIVPLFLILVILAMALAAGNADAADTAGTAGGFSSLFAPYDSVRKALLANSVAGVPQQAKALAAQARALHKGFSPQAAGVPADKAATVKALLPEIAARADRLAAAKDLETARTAFGDLSQPMVRYRDLAAGEKPIVVYCPMAELSWLQPAGELGNPYYGPSMATCGEVGSK
jgi:hypothetical protein